MAKQDLLKSAEPASAMGMLMPVTLTLMCGRHQGIAVVVSAKTVSTTQKVSIASGVSQASTGTSGDLSLLQMLANCVPAIQLDQLSFLSAQCLSVTPVMVTALASLGWQGHTVTGVWWDTGASETMAADPVTVRGAATLSQETASAAAQT